MDLLQAGWPLQHRLQNHLYFVLVLRCLPHAERLQTHPRSEPGYLQSAIPTSCQRHPRYTLPLQVYRHGNSMGFLDMAGVGCDLTPAVYATAYRGGRDHYDALPFRAWSLQSTLHSELALPVLHRDPTILRSNCSYRRSHPDGSLLGFLLHLLYEVSKIAAHYEMESENNLLTCLSYRVLQGKKFNLPV
jgi:hypothetical protein